MPWGGVVGVTLFTQLSRRKREGLNVIGGTYVVRKQLSIARTVFPDVELVSRQGNLFAVLEAGGDVGGAGSGVG